MCIGAGAFERGLKSAVPRKRAAGEVQRAEQQRTPAKTKCRRQEERCGQRARDGAHGVPRVDPGERASFFSQRREPAFHGRKRRAHRGRGREQRKERDYEGNERLAKR